MGLLKSLSYISGALPQQKMTDIVTIGDATLYHGDCLEILPTLDKVDAVVTDPPYGVDFQYESYDDSWENWMLLANKIIPMCRDIAQVVFLSTSKKEAHAHIWRYHEPDWIICWYKGSTGTRGHIGFKDWEPFFVWGKPNKQMHDYVAATPDPHGTYGHPCPKPLRLMEWLVARAGQSIIDPFMGSGTTGVACANLGRKFIGIEIERKYFDIACERIDAAYSQGRLFA